MEKEQENILAVEVEGQSKAKKPAKVNSSAMHQEDDSSEWSLESLEEIKGINIRSLEEQAENHESRPRQKPALVVKFPEKPQVFVTAALHEIGKVVFIVGQLLIVQAQNGAFVVDLDNWVADKQKNLIGFVMDVLGRVENPFYAIKLENNAALNSWMGSTLYYVEGTSKILKDEDIKSLQSKSAAEVEQPVDDSSDEEVQKPQRKFSQERQGRKRERRRSPEWRRAPRFQQEMQRQKSRDRTREREFNRNNSRSRNQHNQRYLQTMYNMHYTEMMRLCNGGFQPSIHQYPQPPYPPQQQHQQPYPQQQPYSQPSQPQQGLFPPIPQFVNTSNMSNIPANQFGSGLSQQSSLGNPLLGQPAPMGGFGWSGQGAANQWPSKK